MSSGRCGEVPFASAFRLPLADTAGAWLDALGAAGLTVDRARRAGRLGDPDPFPVRRLAAAAPATARITVEHDAGDPLDADGADAVLIRAALASRSDAVAGLFAGRPVPARVRAIPVDLAPDHPVARELRWAPGAARPLRIGAAETWLTSEIGLPDTATVRALLPLPDGLAAASDMGLSLLREGRWAAFPWPPGARKGPHVEAMAVHAGVLHVATREAWFEWPLAGGPVRSRRHPGDEDDGRDDVRSLLGGEKLLAGWRCRFVGGDGPRDAISMARDPDGNVWAGTLHGELAVIDGGIARTFADHKGRPVRYLAWAAGALWVAALGALHRFDGASWTSQAGEPTFLHGDGERLWAIRDGQVLAGGPGWPEPVGIAVERPWCLATVEGALWIGAPGRIVRVPLERP